MGPLKYGTSVVPTYIKSELVKMDWIQLSYRFRVVPFRLMLGPDPTRDLCWIQTLHHGATYDIDLLLTRPVEAL